MANCPECRTPFKPRRSDQSFCSAKCNTAFEARALKRSRALYRALYHWRMSRDNPEDLRFICRSVAAWAEEDRAHQRGKPPRHNHGLDRGYERTKRPSMETPGRRCEICGDLGGIGSTTLLRMLGYQIPDGDIGYAHAACIRKARALRGTSKAG